MITGHGNIHALVIRVAAAFDITYRAESQVCWVFVLLGAGRFTGVTANTVIGSEEKAMLFITVGVNTHIRIFVNKH